MKDAIVEEVRRAREQNAAKWGFDLKAILADARQRQAVGGGGSKVYYANLDASRIANEMRNKVVAAICLAPAILANAGVLEGKQATVAGTEARTIEAKGAKYTGPGVTVDGNIVTANAPKSSRLFGRKIGELLKQVRAQ